MPKTLIDLSNPIGSKRIRAGFQPHWRTVFIYKCPNCQREIRVFANAYSGKNPVPGIGAIVCNNCEMKGENHG
jgi:hypothetical protein